MQSDGLPKRLQVCLDGRARLRGWRHGDSGWSPGAPWGRGFATQEADEVFTPDGPPPLLYPGENVLVAPLMANLNAELVAALVRFHTLYTE